MGKQESRVAVSGGDIAVIDHGGIGPDVFLVHSVCHSGRVWDEVATRLSQDAHVVAVDLRGHGQSSAEAVDVEQIPDDLAQLVSTLGLKRPVLVGHDVAGGFATAVAVRHPDTIGALIVIDSPVVDEQAKVLDMVRAVGADVIVDMLTERFGLGRRGPDTASMESFVAEYTQRKTQDWLAAAPDERSLRELLLRAIMVAPDGSWVCRPVPETVRALTHNATDSGYKPGRELLAQVRVPTTVITLSQGRNGSGGVELAELAGKRTELRLVRLDCGPHVLFTDPEAVAREVRDCIRLVHRSA